MRRIALAATGAAVLVATALPTGVAANAATAGSQSVTVDYSSSQGAFNRVGAGIHYGLSEDGSGPSDSDITTLKLNILRGGGAQLQGLNGSTDYGWLGDGQKDGPGYERRIQSTIAVAKRFTSSPINGRYALLLSDLWGLDAGQPDNSPHPCDAVNGKLDCSNYVTFLNTTIDKIQASGVPIYYWEPQNEPNNYPFWNRGFNTDQYWAMWDTAYKTIKSRLPNAKIAGPSFVTYDDTAMGQFLTRAKADGTLPQVLNWHGLEIRSDPVADANAARAQEKRLGISPIELSINEYLTGNDVTNRASGQLNPGSSAWYLSRLNTAGIAEANRGIYPTNLDDVAYARSIKPYGDTFCCSYPNLAGLLPVGHPDIKTDEYWTYAQYARLSGTRYAVTNGSTIAGTATADSSARTAGLLLGDDTGFHGAVTVTLKGLGSQSYLQSNGKTSVRIVRIPSTGGALTGPETVSQGQVTVPSSGTVSLKLDWRAPRDAYAVFLANPSTSSSTVGASLTVNPGFEVDGQNTSTPSGWTADGDTSASYTEGTVGAVGARSGDYRLTHALSNGNPFRVYTYQTVKLANGTYALTAWTVRGGGQNASYLEAKDFGGSTLRTDTPVGSNWQQVTVSGIKVTNGQVTVGLYDDANAGQYTSMDDVELRKVG